MIRRLLALMPRGRRAPAAPSDPYAGVDWTETVLVDGVNFRGLPCEGRCAAPITIHELADGEATCGVCGTTRPATAAIAEQDC